MLMPAPERWEQRRPLGVPSDPFGQSVYHGYRGELDWRCALTRICCLPAQLRTCALRYSVAGEAVAQEVSEPQQVQQRREFVGVERDQN